ncbi:MAG: YceI family protein [Gammaproteobacteria bacterium]|jgi:polyisoprenoid-binding protein YceI
MSKLFKHIVLTVTLLTVASLAPAEEADICSPFMDGKVDESLLATMLSAADDGHLFRIQQQSSQVGFCVNSKLSRIEGIFRDFKGGMALEQGKSGTGQTIVLIKANSLDTEGNIVESMIKGESFFDVEHYPEVLFVSNGFRWTGADTAVLKGDLTLRGITKPVVFNVTLTSLDGKKVKDAEKILVKATTTINRTDFGMKKLTSLVNNSVDLCMSVEALKYGT